MTTVFDTYARDTDDAEWVAAMRGLPVFERLTAMSQGRITGMVAEAGTAEAPFPARSHPVNVAFVDLSSAVEHEYAFRLAMTRASTIVDVHFPIWDPREIISVSADHDDDEARHFWSSPGTRSKALAILEDAHAVTVAQRRWAGPLRRYCRRRVFVLPDTVNPTSAADFTVGFLRAVNAGFVTRTGQRDPLLRRLIRPLVLSGSRRNTRRYLAGQIDIDWPSHRNID
jgi:hypothetical protein